MANQWSLDSDEVRRTVDLFKRLGSVSAVSRELGLTRSTVRNRLRIAKVPIKVASGSVHGIRAKRLSLPKRGQVKRYILTSVQNNTYLHEGVWANLMALADYYNAEVIVGTFSYDKASYRGSRSVKRGAVLDAEDLEEAWYDPQIEPYIRDERLELAPGLVWCGEMNILPTAVDPLNGFESYTGRKSGIFPHAKIALRSVPSGKFEGAKFNYTTGTVTQRNYIQKRAGLRAEYHHCYGGLVVEVNHRGWWFVRQLHAGADDSIHDLDLRVQAGIVTRGNRVEGITWGDAHEDEMDPLVRRAAWGPGGMLDELRPKYQFLHDVLNFGRRNHHEAKDPHKLFERWVKCRESVEDELRGVRSFLADEAHRDWCTTIVVDSNHDEAMSRWLRDDPAAYAKDPVNAVFFLRLQLAKYEAMARKDKGFHLLEHALRSIMELPDEKAKFLREDQSFVLLKGLGGGIECGMHGHLGPNGARGNARNLSRMARPSNVGHAHHAEIRDDLYQAGTSSKLDMGYNKGPSSWSHSEVVTYPNARRAIVTMWKGTWRA